MLLQAVISPENRFKFSNIQINGLAILCLDIDVLSFDLSSLLSRKMGRWVWNRKLKRNDLICDCRLYKARTSYLGAISVFVSWNKARLFLWLAAFLNQMRANFTVFTTHLQVCLIHHNLRCNYCFFLGLEWNNHRSWMEITRTGCLLELLLQVFSTSWSKTPIRDNRLFRLWVASWVFSDILSWNDSINLLSADILSIYGAHHWFSWLRACWSNHTKTILIYGNFL